MDSMRRMNAYVKLNFQRCLSQGKTLVICICLAVFFYLYFGDVRGGLMESGQKIGIMEMFLVVTNNMYTSFTIWIGFVLIICDIPYRVMVCTSICCVLPEGVGSGDRSCILSQLQ